MQALVSQICAGIGIAPEQLQMEENVQDMDVTLTVRLPLDALQKLDGREHRLAKAVRQVLSAAAAAGGKRFHLVAQARD